MLLLVRVSKLIAPPSVALPAMSARKVSVPAPPSTAFARPERSAPSWTVKVSSPSSRSTGPVPVSLPATVIVSLPLVPVKLPSTFNVAPLATVVSCADTVALGPMFSVPPSTSTCSRLVAAGPLMLRVPTPVLVTPSKLTSVPRSAVRLMS
ncbi:hypothetical protein D3C85_1447770 [compost metagenome]